MKRLFLSLQFVFLATAVLAQNDSLTLMNTRWDVKRIVPGVRLKQFTFSNSLFSSNQTISILEVRQRGKRRFFDLAYEPKDLRKTSDFGRASNALAAINGTFFDIRNGGSVDYIESDERVINENRLGINGSRSMHQKAAILFNSGDLSLAKWNGKPDWERGLKAEDLMVSGPLLLLNGNQEPLDSSNAFNKTRHPRSAIAITKKNRVLLITVDGRQANSAGMSLFELTKVLSWLGARDGINLDGGGSTTLWVNQKEVSSVINFPSDNKKWDHEGERKVANVILLFNKPPKSAGKK